MHLQAFELLVLNALDWDLNAVTPVLWRDLILEFIEKHIEGTDLEGDWLDAVVVALNFLKVTSINFNLTSQPTQTYFY